MYVTRGSLGTLFGASSEVNTEIAKIMPVFLTFIEPLFMLVLMFILPPLFGGQIMIWWSTVLARILSALLALVFLYAGIVQ